MYKKYLIIASKSDLAGVNITTQLSQFRKNPLLTGMQDKPNFDFYLRDEEIISDENLDLEKINNYDFIIFASKHESVKKEKTLSVHASGNWRNADLGGESKKICPTSAIFEKQMFETLNENAKIHNLDDYNVTLECTHHGPLISKPCIFIEIGATEHEWQNRRAGFVIAKTIRDVIENFKPNPYNEVAIAIGGPHYCPNFNKIQLNSNVAISHVIPQYALPLDEEMLKQAIEKTTEEVDFAVLDWKGLGNSESRKQIISVLDKLYISYKKTGEINK
ncbi:MAG: D-aminoacyl-tRNA deacylase [Candidatus Pacearchaeota archaeon]|jgi:D-aminoacyl-tRNA deacylase